MNHTIPVKVHNRFDFELTDARTGKVKQKCTCYNIVLNQYFTRLVGNSSTINGIMLGTGTGTPNVTRTSLFSFLIRKEATLVDSHIEYPTSYVRKKITLSPSECVGANITEVGFCGIQSSSGYLTTHSMLKDSEGNQIAIQKTDTDVLTVYATFFVTIVQPVDSAYVLPDAEHSYIIYRVLGVGSGTSYSTAYFGANRELTNSYVVQYDAIGSASVSQSSDVTNLRIHFTAARLNYDCSFNNHMFSYIGIPSIAAWKLPNPDILPNITLRNVPVGNGDGNKTAFDVPIPLFVENSETIRVNGVVMERGVDYTIQNLSVNDVNGGYGELMPCASPDVVTASGPRSSSYSIQMMTGRKTSGNPIVLSYCSNVSDPTNYALYDFGSERLFNRLRIPAGSIIIRYGSGDASRTTPLYVQSSLDGQTWTTVFNPTVGNQIDTDVILPTPVRARYWRIFQHYSSGSTLVASKFPNISIYYYEPGLVFTNPPANGAAIEMDCQIDRPIKNENWVLDFSCAVQFSRG